MTVAAASAGAAGAEPSCVQGLAIPGSAAAPNFDVPRGAAVDDAGSIYVADLSTRTVHVFDATGTQVLAIPASAATPNFLQPFGVAVDGGGDNIYVTDVLTRTVYVFDAAGTQVLAIPVSAATPNFASLRGVAVDDSGNIYVTDIGTDTVYVFDAAGTQLSAIPASAATPNLASPVAAAVDGTGNIYVTDVLTRTVYVFDAAGTQTLAIPASAATPNLSIPHGAAVDDAGNIYVADVGTGTVHGFDAAGTPLLTIEPGDATPNLVIPLGLAVGEGTSIYVTDSNTDTVYRFDCTLDSDGDGVNDDVDNCPAVANPGQEDADGDLIGDACEGDVLPPVVVGVPDRVPNAAGWYDAPVTVSWDVTDPAPSAGIVQIPSDVVADLEGTESYVSGDACDAVGNCATGSIELSIDVSLPEVSLVGVSDGDVIWVDDYVPPTCEASDAVSGLNGVCQVGISDAVPGPGTLTYTATASAEDLAGNSASVSATYTVIVDVDGPSITATPDRSANANGWYNASVTFSFVCDDADSAVAVCPGPLTLSAQGANQDFTVTATDLFGNEGSLMVSGINIDLTDPEVAFSGQQVSYQVDDTVEIDCDASDELSGIDTSTCPSLDVLAAELPVGANALTATATDDAGNTTTVTISFEVVVSVDGLGGLIDLYLPPGGSGNSGIANSLKSKLANGNIEAFINQVNAQCCTPANGKRFSAEQAATLIALAQQL